MSNNEPGETNTYTNQSTNATSCPLTIPSSTAVITPCFETDSTTQQYNTVQSRTFYDGLGRPIETRTPGPGANDTIVFTVYDATNNTRFQSVPFQVARGSSWVDPNTALGTDGKAPAGTTTFYDALGRAFAMREPIFGSSGASGITCSTVPNHTTIFYTSCINYGLGTVTSDPTVHDTNTYATVTSIDPNNHVSISFLDALGRVVYVQYDSGGGATNGPLTPNELKIIQYNPIGLPTQIKVDDLAPQANQTVTSVTSTTQYIAAEIDLGYTETSRMNERGLSSCEARNRKY